MSSAKAREAFDLEREPDKMRDTYGRNRFGQSCLLARRLIEAGVRSSRSTCSKPCLTKSPGTSTARGRSARSVVIATWWARCSTMPSAACWRTFTARPAGKHAGDGHGRVRQDAEGQSGRRPRPLAGLLDLNFRRRRRARRSGRGCIRRDRGAPKDRPSLRQRLLPPCIT